MINACIKTAVENRFITLLAFIGLTVFGVISMFKTPVDAIPDLSENQVIIVTDWTGQNPRNIEDQITYPLTVSMQGLAGVRDIRASSMLGVSMVTVIFNDDIDIYFARDRVSERLGLIQNQLPARVVPTLGPDATGVGHIFMYTVESTNHTLTELRSLQDFTVRYNLQSVPGVAEVASVGGYVKMYQVIVDPQKLQQFGVSLNTVMESVKMANNNVSGKVIDTGNREVAIQGIGFFESPEDIAHTVIGMRKDGIALTIQDIGDVRISGMFRRGILANEYEEKVGGIVVMRYGENPLAVIDAVKKRLEELQSSLPDGVTIVPFYDRTDLIKGAIATVQEALWEEIIITAIVLGLFLWHVRSMLIITIGLTVGVIITFICMYLFGVQSNIMSLGGIIIAIGAMVDADIVICENIFSRLAEKSPTSAKERLRLIIQAAIEVAMPIVPAMIIIILSFLPIFALQGTEGKLFTPLAFTNVFGMMGALLGAVFLVPVLCAFFLKGNLVPDEKVPLVAFLQKLYKPAILWSLDHRKIIVGSALSLGTIGILSTFAIGSEFMPPLDEGTVMYMPITVPDVSQERAQEILIATNRIIAGIPEVEMVVGKAGRALTATDPAPLAMIESFITLKPKDQWRPGKTKEDITREMSKAIKIDNVWNSFTQPIIGRIDMLSTGIRTQLGVKIFGDDPVTLERKAIEVEGILRRVQGAADVVAIRTTGLRYLDIEFNDALLAQNGIVKMHALQAVSAGIGGSMVSKTIEGREQYGIEVRLKQDYRQNLEDIQSLPITGVNGATVLLSSIANIKLVDGPAVIHSENGVLRSVVQLNVRGRDTGSFVKEAQKVLENEIELPDGYRFKWAGQFENQLRARKRLMMIVPLALLLMISLLYFTYKDVWLVTMVMLTIPLGLVGGVLALAIAQFNFSVAVWVGFICLFGNAVETGTVIIVYLENAYRRQFGLPLMEGEYDESVEPKPITHEGIYQAVLEGSLKRLRPILMTAVVSIIGLFPLLFATGPGADVQRPLALVVASGLTTSVFLSLFVLPVLFAMLREKQITSVNM